VISPIVPKPASAERHWRAWGRLLTAGTTVGIVGIDLYQRRHFPETTPLGLTGMGMLLVLALLGSCYGLGSKLADLTEEHGLRPTLYRPLGFTMVALAFLGLMSFSAGATLVTRDVVFHGLLKGKLDTRSHFLGAVLLCSLLLGAFALFPGAHVDWVAVVVLIVSGTLWMWLNNRVLHLGDTLFHKLRGDAILLLGVLAALDARWLPIAVVVSCEHLAYAATKLVAIRRSWYRDGTALVPHDADRLGLAFHRSPERERHPSDAGPPGPA
jgi:hypothetical protein